MINPLFIPHVMEIFKQILWGQQGYVVVYDGSDFVAYPFEQALMENLEALTQPARKKPTIQTARRIRTIWRDAEMWPGNTPVYSRVINV